MYTLSDARNVRTIATALDVEKQRAWSLLGKFTNVIFDTTFMPKFKQKVHIIGYVYLNQRQPEKGMLLGNR